MPYELFRFQDIDPKVWDAFVLAQGSGSIHQVSTWKKFQEKIPGRDKVLGFGLIEKNKEEIIENKSSQVPKFSSSQVLITCLCIKRDVGFKNKFWFYSPRGPVFREELDQAALDFFIQEVSKILKKEGAMFWRLDPYLIPNTQYLIPGSCPATAEYQPTDSLVLDITGTEDEILAQMKRKGRYNIKLAREKGVEIQIIPSGEVTQEPIEKYWHLSQETAGRDGFSTHDKAYHEAFIKDLSPYTVLGLALHEDQPIAGVINTCCGDKAIYYLGASSGNPDVRPLMAPYLLQWEMILYSKKQGCGSYDFTGITPEGQPDHPYKGITQFKEKFGGARATYQGAREIILNKTWYWLYRSLKYLSKK
ncbi:MAG TPA: peptidoglycan bridge formation glycyltransferase FemA/FemB family protein [Candidatus Gracilibacteria bacterium]